MNANEVIANRANELAGRPPGSKAPVHPNDHVNLSQSSNDVFPTAVHLAATVAMTRRLLPAVRRLRVALAGRAAAFAGIVKVGRTHLQDAVPLTLGQEFSGYVAQLDGALARLEEERAGLRALAIGGTAVGTGLNAPRGFGRAVAARLATLTGEPFRVARNPFAALAAHDEIVHASGALRGLARALMKMGIHASPRASASSSSSRRHRSMTPRLRHRPAGRPPLEPQAQHGGQGIAGRTGAGETVAVSAGLRQSALRHARLRRTTATSSA